MFFFQRIGFVQSSYTQMDDGESKRLAAEAAAGDAAAFRRLCEAHYMTVYKIAYKWTGRREDAEDVAQEVFVKLPGKLASFRGESGFTTWLYRVTVNVARDYYRTAGKAAKREVGFAEGFDAPSDEVAADDRLIAAEAYQNIHKLPEPMRDAVLLVFGEDMNHKEAAKILGCAETTVSWRIFQARKLLKPLLAGGKRHAG
jgi:RNA polymerase sigma factor (sigma-70 family)